MRLLPFEVGHPHDNMGLDEALMLSAGEPTLRMYAWSPTGLSLGYFQRWQDFADLAGDHVAVRRLTGGGAIYHEHELTFSLTGPAAAFPNCGGIEALYGLVHNAIARCLIDRGHGVRPAGDGLPSPRPSETWCFEHPTSFDLLGANGRKLLGSAQRRTRSGDQNEERLLHHGSLVLAPPTFPVSPCGSLSKTPWNSTQRNDLADDVAQHIAHNLGFVLRRSEVTVAERTQAREIARQRYGDGTFLRRR